jgi:hypothetical protein
MIPTFNKINKICMPATKTKQNCIQNEKAGPPKAKSKISTTYFKLTDLEFLAQGPNAWS